MDRIRSGMELVGRSWRVVAGDAWLVALVVASVALSAVVGLVLFIAAFGRLPGVDDLRFPQYFVVVPFLWATSFIATWCNCVVTVVADRRLQGRSITVLEAATIVAPRTGRILMWVLLSGVVGLVLFVIAERLGLAGRIANWLFGLAWHLATVFVVPVLVLEDVAVRPAVRRSASLFRSRWAEKVTADATIGLAGLFCALPVIAAISVLALVSLPLAIVLGVIAIAAFVGIAGALRTVLDVAVYRYAVDGVVAGPFTSDDVTGRFKPTS